MGTYSKEIEEMLHDFTDSHMNSNQKPSFNIKNTFIEIMHEVMDITQLNFCELNDS